MPTRQKRSARAATARARTTTRPRDRQEVVCLRIAQIDLLLDVFVRNIKAALPGPRGKALLDRIDRQLRAEGL